VVGRRADWVAGKKRGGVMTGCERGVVGLGAVLLLAACNSISGADEITFDDDDGEGEGGVANAGGMGQGGVMNMPGAGGTTSDGPATTSGATTTNGATVTSAEASSGSGTSPCEYPAGPYGVAEGQTVPPMLTWQGYAEGPSSDGVVTITMSDYFDCDGTKGIDALMVDTSQFG
jgi:hypothetical protein